MLDLIKRCLADEERQDTTVKQALGLLGDLADSFPHGELKSQLLQEWIASEVRNKRGLSSETKRTMKWAKEVWLELFCFLLRLTFSLQTIKRATA